MKNLYTLILVLTCLSAMSAQNFVKDYYVNDFIDIGVVPFEYKNHYLLQFSYLDFGKDNNNYLTPYCGMIKTDTSGNIIDMVKYDSLYGFPGLQFEDKIYMGLHLSGTSDNSTSKLYYSRINADGVIDKQTEHNFSLPYHKFFDNMKSETKLYCSDLVEKDGDSYKSKKYYPDSILIHRFDTNMVYEKTITCPFSYPKIQSIASDVIDDNLFVTAILTIDTSIASSGLNYLVIAYDSLGQKKWEYPLADDLWYIPDEVVSMVKLSDSSVVVLSSYRAEFQILRLQRLTRIDKNGKLIWDYKDFYDSDEKYYYFYNVFKTQNDDIMAVGEYYNNDKDEYPDSFEGYIMRMTKDGEIRWTRRVQDDSSYFKRIGFYNGVELASGGFLVTGYLQDGVVDNGILYLNVLLVKFDSVGCLHPGCGEYQTFSATDDVVLVNPGLLKLSPNPAGNYIRLSWSELPTYAERYRIYSTSGNEVLSGALSGNEGSIEVNTSALPPGIYVVKLSGKGWDTVANKFVKQ